VNKLLATVAIVIAFAMSPARAEDTRPTLLGAGARSGGCGEWIAGRFDDMYVSWVLGYISAVNTWANPGVVTNVTRSMPNVSSAAARVHPHISRILKSRIRIAIGH
jgi:hypothetical protein